MTAPVDLPANRLRCLICGACRDLNTEEALRGSFVRAFLSDHRDCRLFGMPALQCTAEGCAATGIGRDTKCPAHGGKLEDRNL